MRTTGRDLLTDLASEYAKRGRAKAALVSISWYNDMLVLSEFLIMKHAAELNARRTQLTTSNGGLDHSRWLQDVESFIDEVIETSGGHVKNSPELLRAVRWMIGSATAQLASPSVPSLFDTKIAAVADAA